MALPAGADRDHRWCNPLTEKPPAAEASTLPALLVCDSELDILRDRSREFCKAMSSAGVRVDQVTMAGVGHAFQILHNYPLSQARTAEMLTYIRDFINNR